LARAGRSVAIVERNKVVGGLSASFRFQDFLLDYGPHFFNDSEPDVRAFWDEILGPDQVSLAYKGSMYWRGKRFAYPPRIRDLAKKLGWYETAWLIGSLVVSRANPVFRPRNYADAARRQYGRALFHSCMEPYIEKLFHRPCRELAAEWGPGRLRRTSFIDLAKGVLRGGAQVQVAYPKLGTGQFYTRIAERLEALGSTILYASKVVRVKHTGSRIHAVELERAPSLASEQIPVEAELISTMPLPLLLKSLDPPAPPELTAGLSGPTFRGTVFVYLILQSAHLFDEHCIYVNDCELRVGRVTNFANFSPAMRPNRSRTPLCCEYWCDPGDTIWTMSDAQLADMAYTELSRMGLLHGEACDGVHVVRMPVTHPIPNPEPLGPIRAFLSRFENVCTVGRGGAFLYQDQDETILSGIRAAKELCRSGTQGE
jgi:protoporphyrinogen oxidase